MTDPATRERAALDILALLPECWALGPSSFDRGAGRWTYTARGPHPGRGKYPETITGTGENELAAMVDLRIRLDDLHRSDKLVDIDRRGRAAFLDGAEERSRTVEGRPLTPDELERVLRRFPEDVSGESSSIKQITELSNGSTRSDGAA